MRILIMIIALLTINFVSAQKIYKKIQGEYENPHIGDITIKGYELTYNGFVHIYQSETENYYVNYVYYKHPDEEYPIAVRVTDKGTLYLVGNDAEYILIPKEKQEKEAKKKKLDDLLGGIGNTDGKADGGEGDDNQAGDKGQTTGDPNASGYYGNGGNGSGGNYRLGNRKALTMPKPTYDCNEEGRIVVKISVNQSGRVIDAQPGITGSTNSAPCLLNAAKDAALKTTYNADSKAPSKQVGTIIYNFSLSK